MTDRTTVTKPRSYVTRFAEEFQLWNEARRAAAFEDSIFLWIPKNAGTSVWAMLRQNGLVKLKSPRSVRLYFRNSGRVTFGHMQVGSLVDLGLVSGEFVDRAFKFAFARDPYARAVSLYRYLAETVLSNWNEIPSFPEFLLLLADGHFDRIGLYNSRALSQCNPQVAWLRGNWPDKLYNVENLGEFVHDIADRWGISRSQIPHLNQSSGTGVELTREETALIEKIYAEDFEALGYQKRRSSVSLAGS